MKKFRIYLLAAFMLLAANACKDEEFFELSTPPEAPWLTLTDFERAATGPYWLAIRKSAWDNLVGGVRLLKDTQSDDLQLLAGTSGNIPFNEMYNRQSDLENDKTRAAFITCYQTIAACNSALDFIASGNNRVPFPALTQAQIENHLRRIEGELHFMRGFAYWTLASVFLPPYQPGGNNQARILPLRNSFQASFEGAKAPTIGTTEEIYQLILSDFQRAKQLLPERFVAGLHHPSYQFGRANRFAAAAMLAKTQFMMGMNTEALRELDYVIDQNGGDYNLSEDPIEAFNRDDNTRGKEVIWYALYYDPVTRVGANEVSSMTLRRNVGGNAFQRVTWGQFPLSYATLRRIGWMADPQNGNYAETEAARADKRYQQLYRRLEPATGASGLDPSRFETVHTQIRQPNVWCDKYFRGKAIGLITNVPMIRLAEMHLTRALLRFRAGNLAGATADLNAVRVRAGIGPLSGAITEEAIHVERIREMAFEGDRTDYLRSAKMDIPGGDRGIAPIPFASPNLVWALPQAELDLNLNLGRN